MRVLLALLMVLLPASAHAQRNRRRPRPSIDATAEAYREKLRLGNAALAAHKWEIALAEYSAANAIVRGGEPLAGIADAQFELQRWTDLRATIETIAREYRNDLPSARRDRLLAMLQECERHVGRVDLNVAVEGGTVTVDGQAALNTPIAGRVWLLVGEHKIRVAKEGFEPEERTVVAASGQPVTLAVSDLKKSEAPATGAPPKEAQALGEGEKGKENLAPDPTTMSYAPVRASSAPTIDGILDERVWHEAPVDSRFYTSTSIPFGKATPNRTQIQVAYDERYLYVAFRCSYEKPGVVDDSIPRDEEDLLQNAENVGVYVDGRRDRSNSKAFQLSRSGYRADMDRGGNGNIENPDWQGVWNGATKTYKDGWTAEFAIPWGTIGVSEQEGPFEVGITFTRAIPLLGLDSFWALPPPDAQIPPSFFGALTGLRDVRPHLRLYLQPYVGVFVQDPKERLPALRDFTGAGVAGVYAGAYARFRPNDKVQVDATFNPDFSQSAPDQPLTNLDRFELQRPEVRPFFAEDLPRFEFGSDDGSRAFYSRRVGLREGENGLRQIPVLWGAKAVVRTSGTEVAAMNVGLTSEARTISLEDNVSVMRATQLFGGGSRIGGIAMFRNSEQGTYFAGGTDGRLTLFDEHLRFSAFALGSATEGAKSGLLGGGSIAWRSQDYKLTASYQENSPRFDPQLGFFPQLGFRTFNTDVAYEPVINNDLVQRLTFSAAFTNAASIETDELLFSRVGAGAGALLQNGGRVGIDVGFAEEGVLQPFAPANGRIPVAAGRYQTRRVNVSFATPPRRAVSLAVIYSEGGFFGGYARSPSATLGLNVGRFSAQVSPAFYFLRAATGETVDGASLAAKLVYGYTPLIKTQLVVQGNTVDRSAAVQLLNSLRFGLLSQLALVIARTSPSVSDWFSDADTRAIATFTYGVSPI